MSAKWIESGFDLEQDGSEFELQLDKVQSPRMSKIVEISNPAQPGLWPKTNTKYSKGSLV